MIAQRQAWMADLYAHIGYPQFCFLMVLEVSLFPVPSDRTGPSSSVPLPDRPRFAGADSPVSAPGMMI